jgi:magnesium-transporting ATPase (P-type)
MALVMRGGSTVHITADALVRGDVVVLNTGDKARWLTCHNLVTVHSVP